MFQVSVKVTFHALSSTKNLVKSHFTKDVMNALLPNAYEAAVKEAGLEVVAQPKIDVTSMEKVKTGLLQLKS